MSRKLHKALSIKTALTTLVATITIVLTIILLTIVFGAEGDINILIDNNVAGQLGDNINVELEIQKATLADITSITVTGNLDQADLNWFANNRTGLTKLQSLDLSGADATGLKITDYFMADRRTLEVFKYPTGILNIGSNAFDGCKGLTGNLVIPNSVITIGNRTFSGCSGFSRNINDTKFSNQYRNGCIY